MSNPDNPICIYHGNCADGFAAAWVVRKFYGAGNVDFHPAKYGDAPPYVAGLDVIIVDFSYKREVLETMNPTRMIILDHHKTAADDLRGFPTIPTALIHEIYEPPLGGWMPNAGLSVTFDMQRSGAMITWDHFFPGREPPRLLRHIQDRDLWLFKLHGTREIQASVFSYPWDFVAWDHLMARDPAELIPEGAAIDRKHLKDIEELVGVAKYRMTILGYDVPVANLPYTLASDAGNQMAKGEPFAATYMDTPDGTVFSLRSASDGVDVSEIAKQFGGGGHKNAAGFKVPFGWLRRGI